jgi:hypothetical protein
MAEYRHKDTGEVKTQGLWRRHYANVSLPRNWKPATLDGLKLEAVLEAPKPTTGTYETAARDGVVKDAKGNWVTAWAVRDMFSDTYQAGLDDTAANGIRTKRDGLLVDTDWMALSDVAMSAEMTAYRQALRDITDHVDFPYLNDTDWPVKP